MPVVLRNLTRLWTIWWSHSLFIIALVAICFVVGCYGQSEEKSIPPEWVAAARSTTIGEMKKTLGEPNDNASAKQFLNWTISHSGGVKVLKVFCSDVCAAHEKPHEVVYFYLTSEGARPRYMVRLDKPK